MAFGRKPPSNTPAPPPVPLASRPAVSLEEPNPFALAEAGETVVVTLPEEEQPHPVYGIAAPPAPTEEPDSQE